MLITHFCRQAGTQSTSCLASPHESTWAIREFAHDIQAYLPSGTFHGCCSRPPPTMPMAIERYAELATAIFGRPPDDGTIVRLHYGTQADIIADLARLRHSEPAMSPEELHTYLLGVLAASAACCKAQDDPHRSFFVPSIHRCSQLLNYPFQPGGTPLWRPLIDSMAREDVGPDDLIISIAIHFDSLPIIFKLTPDHLARRRITEQQAFEQAMHSLDQRTVSRFSLTSNEREYANGRKFDPGPGEMILIEPMNFLYMGTSENQKNPGTTAFILLPRALQAMAMALKCTVDQLVLCVVLEQRVLAASCRRPSGLASMGNWVHKMAQDFKANVVSTLPLMVMDASAAQATFCVYPQMGEQHMLTSTRLGERRRSLAPWPVSIRQSDALDYIRENMAEMRTVNSLEHQPGHVWLLLACFRCECLPHDKEKFMVCGRCKYARYCGAACQKSDWPLHKAFCNGYKDQDRKRFWRHK